MRLEKAGVLVALLAGVLLSGCKDSGGQTGSAGSRGEPGPVGPAGAVGPAGPSGVSYQRTIIVSPGSDWAESGARLRTALQSAAGKVVWVEPGTYDVGTSPIDLPFNVILRGTSLESTLLLKSGTGALFTSGVGDVEISGFDINMPLVTDAAVLIANGSNLTLRDLRVRVSAAQGSSLTQGLVLQNATLAMQDVDMEIGNAIDGVGIAYEGENGRHLELRDSHILLNSGRQNVAARFTGAGSVEVSGVTFFAQNGTELGIGVDVAGVFFTARDSTFSGTTSGSATGAVSVGLRARGTSTANTNVRLDRALLRGNGNASALEVGPDASVRVTSSEFASGVARVDSGSLFCWQSFHFDFGAFTALDGACSAP